MPAVKPEHAAYIAEAVAAPYQTKRELPTVRPPRYCETAVQRSLFELCGDPAAIQPGIPGRAKPEPIEDPPEPEVPESTPGAPSATTLLRAIIDDAGVGRRRPRDVAIVEAAIRSSIDDGASSFVNEILSVREAPEGLVARVRLFDGGIGMITVSTGSEPAVRDWEAEGDQRDFGYLEGVWVRIEAPVMPPPAEDRPSPEDIAFVEAAIVRSLPEGYPSYAREILRVRRTVGQIFVRITLWDGQLAILRLKGDLPDGDFAWRIPARDWFTIAFDEATWAWIRVEAEARPP